VLEVYTRIGWFAIGVGAVVLVLAPFVARLMHLDLLGKPEHPLAVDGSFGEPAAAGIALDKELRP